MRRIAAVVAVAGAWLTSTAAAAPGTGIQTVTSGALALNAPVVGLAATPSGAGYWRVAGDGAVLSAGDARFYGSMGGRALSRPASWRGGEEPKLPPHLRPGSTPGPARRQRSTGLSSRARSGRSTGRASASR